MAAKVRIYVLCFDDASEKQARRMAAPYEWARVTRISSTKYFENVMFFHTLREMEDEWKHMDFVGTLSYSCEGKGVLLARVDACVRSLKPGQVDVVAFLGADYPMLPHSEFVHPGFGEVWTKLWSALRVPPHVSHGLKHAFYCNYWIAHPTWLSRFMAFQCRVKAVLEEDPGLQALVWADAGYMRFKHGHAADVMSLFERPFYTFHPFLLERVAPLFFHITGARVHMCYVLQYDNHTGNTRTCPEAIGVL